MTRAISLYNKYPQCSCKPWGQPHLIISNTGVGSDWVKRSADCPSLKSMQTLSQTRKMAKHQHDTKTQQPKKKNKNDWAQKPWDCTPGLGGISKRCGSRSSWGSSPETSMKVFRTSGSDLSREVLEFYSFDMCVNAVYIFFLHHFDSSGRI